MEFRRLSPTPFSHAILSTSLSFSYLRVVRFFILSEILQRLFTRLFNRKLAGNLFLKNANELALTFFFVILANEVDLERSEMKVAGCGHLSFSKFVYSAISR